MKKNKKNKHDSQLSQRVVRAFWSSLEKRCESDIKDIIKQELNVDRTLYYYYRNKAQYVPIPFLVGLQKAFPAVDVPALYSNILKSEACP